MLGVVVWTSPRRGFGRGPVGRCAHGVTVVITVPRVALLVRWVAHFRRFPCATHPESVASCPCVDGRGARGSVPATAHQLRLPWEASPARSRS